MSRTVSIWLPRWPILRRLTAEANNPPAEPVDPERPFALSVEASGGPRIAALNIAAEAEGLRIGDRLADARAKVMMLQARPADARADADALHRLALWATRYTPAVSLWDSESGGDGFFLDIDGGAHLFGGEEALLADLSRRLVRFGLPSRLAIADTPGLAWALARFHARARVVLPSGCEAEALSPLPIEALRLSQETCATLRRLGFKRVGALIDAPRAPFAARFEDELLTRLDQALGHASEPLSFIVPPPLYQSRRSLLEPIVSREAIVAVATRLMEDLVADLTRDGVGARAFHLALYRVDSATRTIDIRLTTPTRNPAHVARLIDLKLERSASDVDAGFGFEALSLTVAAVERMAPKQVDLAAILDDADGSELCAALIDRLRQRLGARSVRQFKPVASHLPERAETIGSVEDETGPWPADDTRLRPLLFLSRAEPAEVTALVPDGPPRRFRWRGAAHGVAWAQGPERIASEWWRAQEERPTRDYYLVEDEAGRRFWLYREGLFGRETASPRWFVQGLFA